MNSPLACPSEKKQQFRAQVKTSHGQITLVQNKVSLHLLLPPFKTEQKLFPTICTLDRLYPRTLVYTTAFHTVSLFFIF